VPESADNRLAVHAVTAAADTYLTDLTICLPVDRATAEAAWQLRAATPQRLRPLDALIAASARVAGEVLVHRDPT
jgi:predicted nucleic acid-binding protein